MTAHNSPTVDLVEVIFAEEKLADLCNSHVQLQREYGVEVSNLIRRRLAQLAAAPTLEDLRHAPGRCRALSDSPETQIALTVSGSKCLVFCPANTEGAVQDDRQVNWSVVAHVTVLEIFVDTTDREVPDQ